MTWRSVCGALLPLHLLCAHSFAQLQPNFIDEVVSNDYNFPVGVTFAPDGRMFVWEKGGRVYFVEPGGFLPRGEIVRTFADYAQRHALPLQFGTEVSAVEAGVSHATLTRFCRDHGLAGLEFAERLARAGARVRVPTTLNVGSPASFRWPWRADGFRARLHTAVRTLYPDYLDSFSFSYGPAASSHETPRSSMSGSVTVQPRFWLTIPPDRRRWPQLQVLPAAVRFEEDGSPTTVRSILWRFQGRRREQARLWRACHERGRCSRTPM